MTTVVNKASIKNQTEKAFVDGIINAVSKQNFDMIKIVRSPKCFGAQAHPYKVSKKRNGQSIFNLNLGGCYPSDFNGVDYREGSLIDYTQQIKKFIQSPRVKNFLKEIA